MCPMIRPNRDMAVMIPRKEKLRRLDVCLYRDGEKLVLHRAVRPVGNGCWLIRGDRNDRGEIVEEDRVFAVMQSFFRDDREIGQRDILYGVYSRCIVACSPLLKYYRPFRIMLRRSARKCRSRLFSVRKRKNG